MEKKPIKSIFAELNYCTCFTREMLEEGRDYSYVVPDRLIVLFIDEGELLLHVDGEAVCVKPAQMLMLLARQHVTIVELSHSTHVNVISFLPALQDLIVKRFSTSFFAYLQKRRLWNLNERTVQALYSFYDLYEFNYREMPGSFSTEIANSLFSVFLQLFYQLVKRDVDAMRPEAHSLNTRVLGMRFFALLSDSFKKEHSVSFYADTLCISSKYLTQIIKQLTGKTPKEVIDGRLGMESLFLLTKTDYNIQQISIELGFPDQSYFGRFFKRLFGMSPLRYRANPDLSLLEKLKFGGEDLREMD